MDVEIPGNKPDNPIWMALLPQPPKPKDMLLITLASIAPIAIALLMQRPALRQAIQMHAFHTSKVTCQRVADYFTELANKSATNYQRVQL